MFLFIFLASFLSVNAGELEESYEKLLGLEQDIIKEFYISEPESVELGQMMKKCNELEGKLKRSKNKKEKELLSKQVSEQEEKIFGSKMVFNSIVWKEVFGELTTINSCKTKITDKEFLTMAQANIDLLKRVFPSKCIELKDRKFIYSNECKKRLDAVCGAISLNEKSMSASELTSDLKIRKASVGSYKELLGMTGLEENNYMRDVPDEMKGVVKKSLELATRYVFDFCRTASLAGVAHTAKRFIKEPSYSDLLPEDSHSMSVLRGCAFSKDLEVRIKELISLNGQNETLTSFLKTFKDVQKGCASQVKTYCKGVYIIKGKAILSYETVGGKKREVTKEDVEKDIDDFRRYGTEASALNHSTLLDTLTDCQSVYDSGYRW